MNFSKNHYWHPIAWALVAATFLLAGSVVAWASDPPELDQLNQVSNQGDLELSATPSTEWVWHKTSDNLHPDGNEQQMLWLMNRARANPSTEGGWLATCTDPEIAISRTFYGVDNSLMQGEFDSYPAKLPAAFDRRLYQAAAEHNQFLSTYGENTHLGQQERIEQAGFVFNEYGGSVYVTASSALNAHGAFNIDWDSTSSGMRDGRPHRANVMSVDHNFSNVGLAVYEYTGDGVGPYIVTGNYCHADGIDQHANTFIVGTVWEDLNGNGLYDPGEGKSGVLVMPNQGTYFAITAKGGGYAIPAPDAGTYVLTFTGGALADSITKTVEVVNQSVLCDVTSADIAAGGVGGVGQYNFVDDFTKAWSMNHSGWLGTLTLGQGPVATQEHGNMVVSYLSNDGSQYQGYGFVRTPAYGRDASWGPDHQIDFYINFLNDNGDTRFLGYIFTWQKEAMAGITWWHDIPFGFYALSGAGGTSLHMGDFSLSADYKRTDFAGTYEMNHDSWRGRLELNVAPDLVRQFYGIDILGTYTSHDDGRVHDVRGYTNTAGGRPASWGPEHQIVFYIDFDETPDNWDDDQLFRGYLFSTSGPMAGVCYWHDRPFGFYALR